MREQSRTPLCGPIGNKAFKLSHTLFSTTLLPLCFHPHLPSIYLLAYFSLKPPLLSTDVHQGEADRPCDEGGACWQQEQGDGGGCRHGGHGLCHQRPAQGETERCEERELRDVCVVLCVSVKSF